MLSRNAGHAMRNTQHAQQPLQNESQLPNPQSPPLKHPAPAPCAPVPGSPGGVAV
ncbi:hypothetical protein FHY33_002470 [Xanthomonas arboricola]|nr:hypothetical protein [Xanthomonas campestris]